jgi:hypothetical protein
MSPGFKFHYIPNTFDESPKNQKTLSAIAHFAIIYKAKIKEEHHTVPLGGGDYDRIRSDQKITEFEHRPN